jgi:hypothetical protein
MHPERVLRVINLLDVPEGKRKFWPQHSAVIVRVRDREIVDVIQCFSQPFASSEEFQRLYPGSVMFAISAGDLRTVEELQKRIEWCLEAWPGDDLVVSS